MRKTLLIITALMLVVGCSESDAQQKIITVTETYKDGDVSKISYHKITGNKIELVKEIDWYTNGQKKEEQTYKDGIPDGKATEWCETGEKEGEGTYKGVDWRGDHIKDGKWTYWHKNGQKRGERTYKDGERHGKWTSWYENGQKSYEATFKDGVQIVKTKWY